MTIVLATLKEVFRNARYGVIAAGVGCAIFALAVWLRNLGLLAQVATSPAFSVSEKVSLFVKFLGGIATNATPFSAFLIVTMSIFFGVNAALFLYYLAKQRGFPKKESAGAAGAFVSGIVGVGCASCGSFLLGSLLASFGASGLIAFLPLRGEELTMLSIALLGLSMFWLSKSIQSTNVCAV